MLTALYLVYFGYTPPGIFHIAMNKRSTILDTASPIEPASNPKVEHKTRGFLKGLNSGEGTPVEQLSPKKARDLLAALQASAPHSMLPAALADKLDEQHGLTDRLT